jgi:ATP-dependent exoDNAse (exonuclease V) alpha subunit
MRPDMVLVKVPQYLGPSCLENEDKVVPIVERTSFWMDKKTSCTRKALPLVPSYAISIHKSQGSGLEQVIVNLSEREFAVGLTYTALSRCKTLEGLYFETIPPKDRMTRHFGWQNFTDKLEEDKRLKKLEEETLANVDITDILTDEEEEEDEEMVQ